MRHVLTITADTTDDAIEEAIPFRDMQGEARVYRDRLAAIEADAGGYEVHDDGAVVALFHPALGGAIVNERGPGAGGSVYLGAGEVETVEEAVARWRRVV